MSYNVSVAMDVVDITTTLELALLLNPDVCKDFTICRTSNSLRSNGYSQPITNVLMFFASSRHAFSDYTNFMDRAGL